MAALRNVSTGGKGSELRRSLAVMLKGEAAGGGSCPKGSSSGPVDVSLSLVDDDGNPIPVSAAKAPVVCDANGSTKVKFTAIFSGPLNCKNSESPNHVSIGDIEMTATSDHGVLNQTGKILCKNGS